MEGGEVTAAILGPNPYIGVKAHAGGVVGEPFWRTKTLAQMSRAEWESLCDGCGRCCLVRFEDEDTGEILPTRVACRLLDVNTCACTNYPRRRRYVPDCIKLTPERSTS